MTTQRISVLALLLVLAALHAPTAVLAGEIDPVFAKKMSEAPPGQMFSAIVMMADQVNVPALDATLKKMNATRQFRHELIVTRLMGKARATQGAVLALLDDHASMGKAEEATSMWLVNAILVTATPASLALVSRQAEVGVVYDGGLRVELIRPFDEGEVPENPLDAPEAGIVAINAPSLWSLGYEGQGVLVSNIDTGVYLDHTTLKAQWRGNDPGVTVAEAWHDPYSSYAKPRDLNGHGTHTMGTICGSGGIGVAPRAKWIASATIDRGGGIPTTIKNALLSFQWSADPDQDPKTILDVPVVSSNSWRISPITHSTYVKRCDQTYWNVIDNAEYSGVAVVFAAGNEGTRGGSNGSLGTPPDRIQSAVNVFSVGALNTSSTGIASFSSRGPSGCDKKTIKPEVCARGQSVRSASRYGTTRYTSKSGTSMACPHVAGAIALLHQVWPDATPEQFKTALLTTCDDLGSSGDDNTYGMGRINCLSAYTQLVGLRPNVSASVMGTVRTYNQGQMIWGHVVLSNNTKVEQKVKVALQFYFEGQPTSLVLVPEADLTVPADYSNKDFPILVGLPIPTGLPASVLDPKLWSLRATIKQGSKTFVSEYQFSIK